MRPGKRNAWMTHIAANAATTASINTQRIGWKKIASSPKTGRTIKNSISIS